MVMKEHYHSALLIKCIISASTIPLQHLACNGVISNGFM